MTGKEAKERLKKTYDYRNEYTKNNYDRISVTVPKGIKDKIKKRLPKDKKVNTLINELIFAWLEEPQTVTQSAEDPEELPPLDWSQLPEDLNDMTPEQAEIIRRRCEARKAQETQPETIPPEELPFH